jgi:hypothetical protein
VCRTSRNPTDHSDSPRRREEHEVTHSKISIFESFVSFVASWLDGIWLLIQACAAYAPAGCALGGGGVASAGLGLICNAKPAAIIAITPPDKKAKL